MVSLTGRGTDGTRKWLGDAGQRGFDDGERVTSDNPAKAQGQGVLRDRNRAWRVR